MGGVCRGDAGHERESQREQHLGCFHWRRGRSAAYAERARFRAGVVAGRKDAGVFIVARRKFAGVRAVDGRRRGPCGDASFDRRGHRKVVAGREDDCVHVIGLPGLQRRCVQQEARRGEAKRITTNPGFDGNPVYSPDGRFIAYHAQLTPGYESDRWRVMLYDRQSGKNENLSERFDRSANDLAWSADSKTIFFTAENETLQPVYTMAARAGAEPKKIVAEGSNSGLTLSSDGKTLAFERTSLTMPAEIFTANSDGSGARQLTRHNEAILANVEMNAPETFWFDGAEGRRVQAMMIRPPHFDAAKKYPLLVLLHGGPQTMWSNAWGYRWNAQVFAAGGYVTLMINRRGSTGYGQKFTDEITNDWGGKAYADVMKGVDTVLAKYKFVDGTRMAAVGGSYGGYMADWIATHSGRFKAIISHAGIYDKFSMYATEELWFEEHDMQGTPWTNPESYRKWAPLTNAAELGKFKTPTLVICGERDYRVPYTQSLEFFNTLQRQGVPSKLMVFPDEGHWILKPQNAQFWYKTFFDWLGQWMK